MSLLIIFQRHWLDHWYWSSPCEGWPCIHSDIVLHRWLCRVYGHVRIGRDGRVFTPGIWLHRCKYLQDTRNYC